MSMSNSYVLNKANSFRDKRGMSEEDVDNFLESAIKAKAIQGCDKEDVFETAANVYEIMFYTINNSYLTNCDDKQELKKLLKKPAFMDKMLLIFEVLSLGQIEDIGRDIVHYLTMKDEQNIELKRKESD